MITEGLKGRDFIRLQDFSKAEIETIIWWYQMDKF